MALFRTHKKSPLMRAFFIGTGLVCRVPVRKKGDYFLISSSSTSNIRVALGGMAEPAPFSP